MVIALLWRYLKFISPYLGHAIEAVQQEVSLQLAIELSSESVELALFRPIVLIRRGDGVGHKNAGRKHPARNYLLLDGLKAFCGGRWFSDNRCLRIEKN